MLLTPPRISLRVVLSLLTLTLIPTAHAVDADAPALAYLKFIRAQAAALRSTDKPTTTLDAWTHQEDAIREGLLHAWGGFPSDPCPLAPKILGTLDRDGYRVEKVVFQTRPGVLMTANAYVPKVTGPRPALLMVHGHWSGAKQDPTVQMRCIGAAKLGFFVLAVDAFGAGERGVDKALGEYHGAMTGATLLPVGLPLSGLQVYENMRAVDYLLTRHEVDGEKIGITGASGGGNQSMYAGAWDQRIKSVVPVCSVGNYGAYLGVGCCLCELVPGALRFTEEAGVLGLVAPRALNVFNATADAVQFSVAASNTSIALAEPIFALNKTPANLRHTIFESKHDYSRPMREAMYGWMTLHLKGEGDGSPIAEPAITPEDPETLRCYSGTTRPDDFMTIPRFAALEGRKLIAAKPIPRDETDQLSTFETRRKALIETVFGGFPRVPAVVVNDQGRQNVHAFTFESEPGVEQAGTLIAATDDDAPFAVLIGFEGGEKGEAAPFLKELRENGWSALTFDLRSLGQGPWPSDRIHDVSDHNTAEWALWIGRPLLGQWVFDTRRVLDAAARVLDGLPGEVVLIGKGRGALVALCAGAIEDRVTQVAAIDLLSSYVSETPYRGQTLGVMAPGILREVGDIPQIAAMIPTRLIIAGSLTPEGKRLNGAELHDAFEKIHGPASVTVQESTDVPNLVRMLSPLR